MVVEYVDNTGENLLSLFQPATSFTLLENMIIWCNIQAVINPVICNSNIHLILVNELKSIPIFLILCEREKSKRLGRYLIFF